MIRRISLCAALLLPLGAGALAAQDERNHLTDRWEITLSGAAVVLGSKLRVDGETRPGTDIDVERVLGLARTKVQPRLAIAWRPGRRHELEVGYQVVRRDALRTLTEDFIFRDSTFRVGLGVRTRFDSDQLFLNYRYAFRAHERLELGMGVGVGALFFDVALDALAGGTGGGTSGSVQFSRDRSTIGPTGSIGLYGKWRVGGASYLGADLRALRVNIGRLEATIGEGGLAYRYFLSPTFGLEAGYGISAYKLAITSTGDAGRELTTLIRYSLQNLRLGAVVAP